ncbi:hypothetical protein [Roseibium alexandrii]|uniref:hypothetical protein n=1 Tax=Roseibium alexandrii TaxID=388408 RepID=UPI0037528486
MAKTGSAERFSAQLDGRDMGRLVSGRLAHWLKLESGLPIAIALQNPAANGFSTGQLVCIRHDRFLFGGWLERGQAHDVTNDQVAMMQAGRRCLPDFAAITAGTS